jgi:mono/diheme cytochrome c family protein
MRRHAEHFDIRGNPLSREGRGGHDAPPSRCWHLYPIVALALLALTGCDMLDMYDQPHKEPFEASQFFANGMSARPLVPGTVARGQLREDDAFYTGSVDGKYVEELPVPLTPELLARGRERFDIYCSMCHGPTGRGDGMIVQRGFKQPPSYHTDHLRNAPVGHFYDVITNGYRTMMPYNIQVEPRDRWAIVAYVRVLQTSQNGTLDDVPQAERAQLEGAPQ